MIIALSAEPHYFRFVMTLRAGGPNLRQESIPRFASPYQLRNQIKGAPLLGFFEKGLATVVASVDFYHP